MPFHSEYPNLVVRMREANKLMQFAMRRSPEEYYDVISKPQLPYLSEQAGRFTAAEYSRVNNEESLAVDLFATGINDVIPPFLVAANQKPDISQTQALEIINSEQTIATYGLLASMTQTGLHHLYVEAPQYIALNEDESAITLTQPIRTSPDYGCEAVDARSGTPEMSPLFKKFVPWAGSLAVLAYFEHR